ncbi:MAG: septum formation initiator family protein [Acidimicrobiales bacterium]|jgi:cell division protein FtsB|nr:septum formation initiator family protein [Acidimicrobiales bacterium]
MIRPFRRRAAAGAEPVRATRTGAARPADQEARSRGSRAVGAAGRLVVPLVLVGLTVGVMVLGVFPTRTWLDQRATLRASEERLAELEEVNAERRAQVEALMTDAEIERLAREEYGYAKVGEEVYHVLPPPRDPVRLPEAWPFNRMVP